VKKLKVFSVYGISKTGKTTTIENIIREFKKRRYTVGSVKEIHYEDFSIDTKGTNTARHGKAGAEPVTARGYYETDILYSKRLSLDKILKHYSQDYVIFEGIEKGNFPKILTASSLKEIDERLNEMVFAISGKISNQIDEYRNIPVIDAVKETQLLVDLIVEKVYEKLPDFPPECCTACGYSCRELGKKILKGKAKRDDCILSKSNIKLNIDGKGVDMVPFVQKLLNNAVLAVVSELEGYEKDSSIKVQIGGDKIRGELETKDDNI